MCSFAQRGRIERHGSHAAKRALLPSSRRAPVAMREGVPVSQCAPGWMAPAASCGGVLPGSRCPTPCSRRRSR